MSGLPYPDWRDTLETLHMMTQVVGKIQLALAPPVNHWWHVAQHVSARGLRTEPLPHGDRTFDIELDLVDHVCRLMVSDGDVAHVPLESVAVAEFHDRLVAALDERGLHVDFWRQPVEVADPIAFDEDRVHRSYDATHVTRFFHVLSGADRILRRFRGEFLGKSSPVHFFWGSFDLAVSRFSGREAPPHPGGIPNLADHVTRTAYSHEVFSAGWWPGSEAYPMPAFYAYAYPEPAGFAEARVPSGGLYSRELSEFVLPWPQESDTDPVGEEVIAFLRSAYEAAAEFGDWDRLQLEPQR
ncbi:MAG TPA: DUF5996 family protein [Longimicrobiales bacterium]|nr:DUF5996 family protein [Longimicrobiales bacterium]